MRQPDRAELPLLFRWNFPERIRRNSVRLAEHLAEIAFILETASCGGLLDRAALHLQNTDCGFQAQFGKKFRRGHPVDLMENPGKVVTAVSRRTGNVVHADVIRQMPGAEIQNGPEEGGITLRS